MVEGWGNDGYPIPLIACGNPWHYGLGTEGWQWLASTTELQTETYNYDYDRLRERHAEMSKYIMWNMFAAFQELAEASVEFSWKPWAVDQPFANRDRIRDEIIDVNHFLGNILSALGVTDKEYEEAYREKQDKNRRRAASGTYSAKKGTLGEGSEVE
jgi:hypothetical protein